MAVNIKIEAVKTKLSYNSYSQATHVKQLDIYLQLYNRVGTENRTSLDNPVILAVESFKVTSYKFRFSDETMFILPSNDFLLEFFGQLLQTNK